MKKTPAMTFGGTGGAATSGFGAFGGGFSSAPAAEDEAVAKARSLSQMPTFLGSGGGIGSGSGSGKGAINADDAEERAARARRNARFGDAAPPPSNNVFAAATATPLPFQNDEEDFGALQQQQLARGAPIVGTCEWMYVVFSFCSSSISLLSSPERS